MEIKGRLASYELKTYRALNPRMNLSTDEKQTHSNLEKGFEGELMFDKLLETLPDNWLTIGDLLLRKNNNYFQIDSTVISHDKISLFEVKNFEGDFYIENGKWYTMWETEIKNPLIQVERNESLFRQFLQDLGMSFAVEYYLVFINPEFTLYNAPKDKRIIFPSQLNRFMKKFSSKNPRTKERHMNFAKQLVSEHITNPPPFIELPKYSYGGLEKGVFCALCRKPLDLFFPKRTFVCHSCGHVESMDAAVLRSVEEYRLLFSERKVTTSEIVDWCKVISEKTIRRILSKNFELVGHTHKSFYI